MRRSFRKIGVAKLLSYESLPSLSECKNSQKWENLVWQAEL